MKLQFSNESLRRKIPTDPDDEPTAGSGTPMSKVKRYDFEPDFGVVTQPEGGYVTYANYKSLEHALRNMMAAYERRVRTDCTVEQLAKEPWRCAEFVVAEQALLPTGVSDE